MLETLKVLDDIRLNFSEEGLLTLNITLAFIMFGVALEIKVEHFKKVFQTPKATIIGVFSQFILLPAVTFIVVILLKSVITPTIALGMLLVASCPGGNISNFISSLAKGNVALSVSLTAIATILSLFMTPLNFALWGDLYISYIAKTDASSFLQPLTIPLGQVFQTVFILLGIPLIIGMTFNHKLPKLTAKIVKPIKILSILIFIGIVVLAFSNNYEYFVQYIKFIFIIVLIHNAIALSTGYGISTLFNLKKKDRRSITIETGIQNSGLGLVLLFNPKIFPEDLAIGGMAFITAWWGIWHILAGLGIAGFMSRYNVNE